MGKVVVNFTYGVIVALVALTGAAGAQTPIGVAAWRDTVTGAISRSIGPGGTPVLNYQKADDTWDAIVDDWVQVGDRQVWKSTRGNHRVFADSTGAVIYAKGNHFLGISPGPLVKFDKSDSTWVTLKPSIPDSVSISGRTITFHNVYPGIDLRLENNAKVFRRFAYQVVFHQEARDSLAAWGPWTGFLLGTATKLNVDSLNLTLRDMAGVFGVTTTGRMVDGWVSLGSADTTAFYLGTAYLRTVDTTTSIPVRKWLVRFAGSPWLVELFDPIAAGALPAGDLWHNVTFGRTTVGSSGASLEDSQFGGVFQMGSTAGTLDSLTYNTNVTTADHLMRMAIYEWFPTPNGPESLVDSTAEWTATTGQTWRSRPVINNASLVANQEYILLGWSEATTGFNQALYTTDAGELGSLKSYTYASAGWQDPLGHGAPDEGTWHISVYATYTEVSAGRRRHIQLKAGR